MSMNGTVWKKNEKSVVVMSMALLIASLLVLPAYATVVSIDNIFMKSGEDAVTQIMINNVSNLGVADVTLSFEPSVVHIISVGDSDSDFLLPVINNSAGTARIGGMDFGDRSNGNVKLAEVTLKAVGDHGNTSALNIFINELKEASAIETSIPATEDDGTASINIPPVAVAVSSHRCNNVGADCPCKAIFNASASYDPDSDDITSYDWSFGDGYTGEGLTTEYAYSSYLWNSTSKSYNPFKVALTVNDTYALINTTDIPVEVYIAGDANGDGEVNIVDAVWVGRHWRAECTGSTYVWVDPQADGADLNNDCEINIQDAVIIGANWRHTA